mmetsp:Transcript_284/g.641  ORF Transcript_284/g.641 Transcript_284/m.641 type:complete len:204 (+) Transcript_284:300-911(+)
MWNILQVNIGVEGGKGGKQCRGRRSSNGIIRIRHSNQHFFSSAMVMILLSLLLLSANFCHAFQMGHQSSIRTAATTPPLSSRVLIPHYLHTTASTMNNGIILHPQLFPLHQTSIENDDMDGATCIRSNQPQKRTKMTKKSQNETKKYPPHHPKIIINVIVIVVVVVIHPPITLHTPPNILSKRSMRRPKRRTNGWLVRKQRWE